MLQDIAEDFVENVAAFACELVKHREGNTLEAKDLQLALGAPACLGNPALSSDVATHARSVMLCRQAVEHAAPWHRRRRSQGHQEDLGDRDTSPARADGPQEPAMSLSYS